MRSPLRRPRVGIVAAFLAALALLGTGPALAADQGIPNTPAAHHAAGLEHLKAGRVQEAVAEFRQALRLDRNYLPALLEMADLLSSTGRLFQAFGVLQHAASVAPTSPRLHALFGRCYFHLRKFKQGREHFHQALDLDPDPSLTEPHFALAVIEAEQGRLAEARKHIQTYLQRAGDTEGAQAWQVLANISLQMKDYDAALAAYAEMGKANPSDTSIQMESARILLTAGRYAEAEQAYQALREKKPEDRDVLRGLFESSYKRGAYQQSIAAMRRLAELERWSCEPLIKLARAYRMLNQFPRARQHAERCLALIPEHAFAHFLLGRTWYSEGELGQAKTALEKSLQADPNYVEALYWLATVELRQGETGPAVARLEKAVSLNPEHEGARYALALEYARQSRPDEAKKQAEEFRRLKSRRKWKSESEEGRGTIMPGTIMSGVPLSEPADRSRLAEWTNLAKYLVQEDKPRDALQVAQEASRIAPEDAEVLRVAAVAHTELGEIEEALATYAEAEKRGPSALLFLGRGKVYFRLEEDELALADLRRAASMELPPDKAAETHVLLASLLNKKKQHRDAERELRRALAREAKDAAARTLLGWTLLELGKPAEAVVECRRVLTQSPGNGSARLVLARALIEQRETSEAARHIEQAARSQGESGLVLLTRGELAAAQGMDKVAIDYLARAGQVDPSQVEAFYLLGRQLLRTNRSSEAAVAFEKATIVDATHSESWLELGKIYLNANRLPAAIGYFRQAVAAAPESAEAHYQLAVALGQAAQLTEAAQEARQAKALGHAAADKLLESLANPNPR